MPGPDQPKIAVQRRVTVPKLGPCKAQDRIATIAKHYRAAAIAVKGGRGVGLLRIAASRAGCHCPAMRAGLPIVIDLEDNLEIDLDSLNLPMCDVANEARHVGLGLQRLGHLSIVGGASFLQPGKGDAVIPQRLEMR